MEKEDIGIIIDIEKEKYVSITNKILFINNESQNLQDGYTKNKTISRFFHFESHRLFRRQTA